ncbi:MAG TPA: serine hydrolase [Chloroflexota bacterium]|nr:serine hydrolase [Chloroflexota bacterium]
MIQSTAFSRSAPEAQGIQSRAIQDFVAAVEREVHDLHSLILLRHGTIVAEGYWEPYGPTFPHMLFSLSKSFTSTAIGFLVAEGRLSIDDHVLDFFLDETPREPSDNLRAMRVRHLLTMNTGHDTDPTRVVRQEGQTWSSAFLSQPVDHEPGTHFVYNSVATYMLSAILQRITGQRMIEYLQPRLFAPLGIENPTWETSPEGVDTGGWGLSIKTMDIARFGQIYLQGGIWQGERLLPEAWVAAATARQVPNGPSANPDWEQGYGYQFWRCRHGAYRGDGAFGQFCLVMPDQDSVLAITSGLGNMQAVLDLVWKHLLPALGTAPLADDSSAEKALADRLATLRLVPAGGGKASPRVAAFSGREFSLAPNSNGLEAIRFDFGADTCSLTVRDSQGEQQVPCGNGQWSRSEGMVLRGREDAVKNLPPAKLAASAEWSDDQTLVVELCWYETPFRRRLMCHFEGDQVVIDQKANVGFGQTDWPRLEGTVKSGQ